MPTTREMDRQAEYVKAMYEELMLDANDHFAREEIKVLDTWPEKLPCIESKEVKALAMAVCEMIYDLKEEMERNYEPKKHDDY